MNTNTPAPSPGIALRIFAYIVAVLSAGAGIACIVTARKFAVLYDALDADLPVLTQKFLVTSGLFPGGILFGLAVLIAAAAFAGLRRTPIVLSAISLLLVILSAVVLPQLLMKPFIAVIQEIEPAETPPTTDLRPLERPEGEGR